MTNLVLPIPPGPQDRPVQPYFNDRRPSPLTRWDIHSGYKPWKYFCPSKPLAMSLASLPVELLDAICEPLASSASTLASLALTCAIANPSATRMLYRAVAVSAYAGNLSVVHTLATRTDLAQLVREFSITLDDANVPFRAFYVQLQMALQGMPLLTSLELHVNSGASWVLSGLDNSSCLEHFSCSFPLDAHVTAFLSGTPALRSLQISDPAPPASTDVLPQNYVPRLESYTGPASLLPLLASRPLTTIYLTGDLKIEDIPQCSGAPAMRETDSQMNAYSYPAPENSDIDVHTKTHQVHVFSAVTSAPPVLLLEALALAYPSMVCLRLMTTYAFWEAPDMVCLNAVTIHEIRI